jgi:hypothetical protein
LSRSQNVDCESESAERTHTQFFLVVVVVVVATTTSSQAERGASREEMARDVVGVSRARDRQTDRQAEFVVASTGKTERGGGRVRGK